MLLEILFFIGVPQVLWVGMLARFPPLLENKCLPLAIPFAGRGLVWKLLGTRNILLGSLIAAAVNGILSTPVH